jgi:hypothetical protein
MNIVLSFIGKLPGYIVECIHQIRCYYKDDVYIIIDDLSSDYLKMIDKYDVNIIDYESVKSKRMVDTYIRNSTKFDLVRGLTGREQLFLRSIERFFLLQNLMSQKDLQNVLFLEIDNLIYDNPYVWLPEFSKHELCYMYDDVDRCSTGLMYVKSYQSLKPLLEHIVEYIEDTNTTYISEMYATYQYFNNKYKKNQEDPSVQLLPTIWNIENINSFAHMNYGKYGDTVFDALAIGCYLLGCDTFHTRGQIILHQKAKWCDIDYTKYSLTWKSDYLGRKKPYIWNGEKWLLINNLHVHSKDLKSGLSVPMDE